MHASSSAPDVRLPEATHVLRNRPRCIIADVSSIDMEVHQRCYQLLLILISLFRSDLISLSARRESSRNSDRLPRATCFATDMAMTMAMANGFHRAVPSECRAQLSAPLSTIPTDKGERSRHHHSACCIPCARNAAGYSYPISFVEE